MTLILPSLPSSPMFDESKTMTREWQVFFRNLYTRVGGFSGGNIVDVVEQMIAGLYSIPVNYGKRIDELEQRLTMLPALKNYDREISDLKTMFETLSIPRNFKADIDDMGLALVLGVYKAREPFKYYFPQDVFNDWVFVFDTAKVPAVNAPTWAAFVGNLNKFTFGVNDLLESSSEALHDYKEGTDLHFHLHWVTNGLDGVDKAVNWEIEYSISNSTLDLSGTTFQFPAPTVISNDITIPANTPDRTHIYSPISQEAVPGFKINGYIAMRVRRIATAGDDPTSDPFGIAVGVHQLNDTPGSRLREEK